MVTLIFQIKPLWQDFLTFRYRVLLVQIFLYEHFSYDIFLIDIDSSKGVWEPIYPGKMWSIYL